MMVCLVTDRRRLTTAETPLADARRCLVTQARHAVAAGIHLIQLRERDLEAQWPCELAFLVRARRDGRMVFYTLDDQHIVRLFEQGMEHVEERK